MGNLFSIIEEYSTKKKEKQEDNNIQNNRSDKLYIQLKEQPTQKKIDTSVELKEQVEKLKRLGKKLLKKGEFHDALNLYKETSEMLLEEGNKRLAVYFTLKFNQIRNLILEQDEKLEDLYEALSQKDEVKILISYHFLIETSKKIKDNESIRKYQAELDKYLFENKDKFNEKELKQDRKKYEKKANLLKNQNSMKKAVILYKKCLNISLILKILGNQKQDSNIDDYRRIIKECNNKT
ncbi:MAG: hypothetical protein GF329_18760 [Candidatus Lokiarchaeota archaeon]|nr:hypothetical protein [Candidatus Lokiarchaeota archaeon]